MLMNLLGVAQRQEDPKSMVRYLEGLVAVDDQDGAIRGMRAVIRHQQGRKQAALDDLDWILEHRPAGIDLERVAAMRDAFSGR
jgi:regulator of sirC expression with transglutaminase-like and TPR domain